VTKQRCCKQIMRGSHFYRCTRNGTLTYKGKMYCKSHHPPTVDAKANARQKEYSAKLDAKINAAKELQQKANGYDKLKAENERLKNELVGLQMIVDQYEAAQ
jgi:hypothetical protein